MTGSFARSRHRTCRSRREPTTFLRRWDPRQSRDVARNCFYRTSERRNSFRWADTATCNPDNPRLCSIAARSHDTELPNHSYRSPRLSVNRGVTFQSSWKNAKIALWLPSVLPLPAPRFAKSIGTVSLTRLERFAVLPFTSRRGARSRRERSNGEFCSELERVGAAGVGHLFDQLIHILTRALRRVALRTDLEVGLSSLT